MAVRFGLGGCQPQDFSGPLPPVHDRERDPDVSRPLGIGLIAISHLVKRDLNSLPTPRQQCATPTPTLARRLFGG